ncbi:Imidazole glycerol phosphate synthase subunit HisH [uncultured archaeon]|nr:Imidazole glycerol phosphate synthase subunit HisH [uncultured archaeon]
MQMESETVVIIDYGAGNLASVQNALDKLGAKWSVSSNPAEIRAAKRIIFPGVGSFGSMMERLRERKLDAAIRDAIASGTPFLGICLGMQALFESSEESPGVKGLGVLEGEVVKFQKGKVPQVGWNEVKARGNGALKSGYFYFVNSYYCRPKEQKIVAATTDYFGEFASVVSAANVMAVQYHPEKSGRAGMEFLQRWLEGPVADGGSSSC